MPMEGRMEGMEGGEAVCIWSVMRAIARWLTWQVSEKWLVAMEAMVVGRGWKGPMVRT